MCIEKVALFQYTLYTKKVQRKLRILRYNASVTDDDLLTVQEAAAKYKLAESTIRSVVRRGHLSWVHWRGRKLLKVADLEAYRAQVKMGRPKKAVASE